MAQSNCGRDGRMAPPGSNKRMGAKAGFVPSFCHHDTRGPPSIFPAQKTGTIADFPIRHRGGAYALAPLRTTEWLVYAKKPFAGPKQVLAYLARYTHRVAIANSRLVDLDETHVSFLWKDYRESGDHQSKVMRITIAEFIRRFLLHVLPNGFHRIRSYGLPCQRTSRRQACTLSKLARCPLCADGSQQR